MPTSSLAPSEPRGRWALIRPGRTASAIYLSIFAMLVIVTAVSWLIYDSRRNLVLEAERTTGNAAFFLADHATRLFEASDLALLEASNAVKSTDWDAISKDLLLWERLKGLSDRFPYIDNIWLNDSTGDLRMSTVALPDTAEQRRRPRNLPGAPGSGQRPFRRLADHRPGHQASPPSC